MTIVPSIPFADIPAFPDVPPLVLALLGDHLAPMMDWFTAHVYGPMFARCPDHPLIALKAWYGPSAVVDACAGFHHAPGTPGKSPDFTIEHFVRAEFVRAWAGTCSDRELEHLLGTDFRIVFISDFHPFLRAAATFNDSPLGRTLLGGRWQVEPVVAWLTRYQGCRRARRIGTAAAQSQLSQACAMRNLLMWLSRVRRGLAPPPS